MNEADLVRLAQAGDEEAMGELFTQYHERTYHVVVRMARRAVGRSRFLTISLEGWREQKGAEPPDPEAEAALANLVDQEELWRALGTLSLAPP